MCSVGAESSIADEVSEVLNGISPNDLPDIASDDENDDDELGEEASNALSLGAAAASMDNNDSDDSDEDSDIEGAAGVPSGSGMRGRTSSLGARSSASSASGKGGSGKKDRHFWQYNVQAKGPKGQKIVVDTKLEDPHVLNEIVDPVFSGDVQLQGIKHR